MSESEYECELGHVQTNEALSLCRFCIIARHKQRLKLLEFVKQLAHESVYEKYENLNEMNWAAFELLKEMGEIK